jgi:hypothetical protein
MSLPGSRDLSGAILAGRSLREAARRKQADHSPFSRTTAGQVPYPRTQPAGSVAKHPVKGFSELLGGGDPR